jgi:hypothetical protein
MRPEAVPSGVSEIRRLRLQLQLSRRYRPREIRRHGKGEPIDWTGRLASSAVGARKRGGARHCGRSGVPGRSNRRFKAFDAETGKVLWETIVGGIVSVSTITYAVNWKQYVAVMTGEGQTGTTRA